MSSHDTTNGPLGGINTASGPAPQWHETTPSSSAQTSDRMTPDNDSDDDDDLNGFDGLEVHAERHTEMYEMQDRNGGGLEKGYRQPGDQTVFGSDDEDESEEDVPVKQQQSAGSSRRGWRRRRGSTSTAASFQLYTPDEEKAVVRKFDKRLVVFLALLYMLSFLDRSNIGNARIAGMDDDLHSGPGRDSALYEWALTAFYITYITFEWMALLWKIIPAHIYVSVLVLTWGLTASLQAVAVNYPMLIFLRAMLGIGEAGFTGVPFYLSFFFKRNELAFRTAMFISAAPLATTFASSLAWLIMKLGESGPIAPWRLLFLVEGFPSVLVAAIAWHIVPDSPQTASYLSLREKKVARLRLRREQPPPPHGSSKASPSSALKIRDTLAVFADPVAWLTACIFFLTNMAYSSLPVFLPTILTAMGHTPISAQALAAPPYFASFLIVLATAHASDVMGARSPLLLGHAAASAVGYAVLASSQWLRLAPGSWVRYMAVYPAAIGFFNVVVLTIAWSINNQRGEARQGGGFALLQAVGQCGPLVGTRLYPDKEGSYYTRGMTACAAAMLGVVVLAGGLRWYLRRLNRALEESEGITGGEEEGIALVGTGGRKEGAGFRYML